ncbi:MAG TPA: NADP-dependent oxidoreductase [Trueperaceae bacterium]|nr:NADP-dependent oxidoreductase [Trueperaceae bacterium]
MPRAVRFDEYGGIDVLNVVEVPRPETPDDRVLVRVMAAGINPGEAAIREGRLHARFPAAFPSGEGSDLAGIVEEVGSEVRGIAVGDEVLGFTNDRASHAEYVVAEADKLVHKPRNVSWESAGALFVAGTAAYATVRAVAAGDGDTVVVSAAAGGVGTLAVQLARRSGARVIGLASEPHHAWLEDHGALPLSYSGDVGERIRRDSPGPVDAFIDCFGGDYVRMAVEDLAVEPERIDTIADFAARERFGVKTEGTAMAASAEILGELVRLVGQGELEVPVARVYPLDDVRDAYRELEERHTLGKIVLRP